MRVAQIAKNIIFVYYMNMIKPVMPKVNNKELFCHKYWQQVLKTNHITSQFHTEYMDVLNFKLLNIHDKFDNSAAFRKALKKADLNCMLSKPTKYRKVLYRGLKYDGTRPWLLDYFNRCANLKKGERILFPEYSFVTKYKDLAFSHMTKNAQKNTRKILFEITIPPKSRLIEPDYNYCLPRSSILVCTGTKTAKYEGYHYQKIKLKLQAPISQPPQPLTLIDKLLNLF